MLSSYFCGFLFWGGELIPFSPSLSPLSPLLPFSPNIYIHILHLVPVSYQNTPLPPPGISLFSPGRKKSYSIFTYSSPGDTQFLSGLKRKKSSSLSSLGRLGTGVMWASENFGGLDSRPSRMLWYVKGKAGSTEWGLLRMVFQGAVS